MAPNGPTRGGDSSSFTTPQLAATTSYWVRVTSDCGTVDSRTATVTVLAAPTSFQATRGIPNTTVSITWNQVSSASKYIVERATSINGPFSAISNMPTTALSASDAVPASAFPVAYVYRVRSANAAGVPSPALSPIDYAVTGTALFSDEPIRRSETFIRAAHIVELRNAIDALRAAVPGLPSLWQGASPPSGIINAITMTDLLAGFNQARAAFAMPDFQYSAGIPMPASNVPIKLEHVQEVRDGLR
jgi:hypothetical protein